MTGTAGGLTVDERELVRERIWMYLADHDRELDARRRAEIGDDWRIHGVDAASVGARDPGRDLPGSRSLCEGEGSAAGHLPAARPRVRGGQERRPRRLLVQAAISGAGRPRPNRKTQTFETLAGAKAWRAQFAKGGDPSRTAGGRVRRVPTVREAGDFWLAEAEAGRALNISGEPFKPSTLSGYRAVLRGRIYPALGGRRLDAITRGDVLAFVGRTRADGVSRATARNAVMPLRTIYRYALDHEWIYRNPTVDMAMPGVSQARRERFLAPNDIGPLLAALDDRDRPLWATAIYAGLRRGELMALRWADVDLAAGVITVAQAYSRGELSVPKSDAGRRSVPLTAQLRALLLEHRNRTASLGFELVFARGSLAGARRGHRGPLDAPFSDQALGERAKRAWAAAGLEPIGLHACRHTFASLLFAAGASIKVTAALLGHADESVTTAIYVHLQDDGRANAIRALDAFLEADVSSPRSPGGALRLVSEA